MEISTSTDSRGLHLLAKEAGHEILEFRRKSEALRWTTVTWRGHVTLHGLYSFFGKHAPPTGDAAFGALVFGPDKRLRFDLPKFDDLASKIPAQANFVRLEHTPRLATPTSADFVLWTRLGTDQEDRDPEATNRISLWADYLWLKEIDVPLAGFVSMTHVTPISRELVQKSIAAFVNRLDLN